jgi:hypothetical protein
MLARRHPWVNVYIFTVTITRALDEDVRKVWPAGSCLPAELFGISSTAIEDLHVSGRPQCCGDPPRRERGETPLFLDVTVAPPRWGK